MVDRRNLSSPTRSHSDPDPDRRLPCGKQTTAPEFLVSDPIRLSRAWPSGIHRLPCKLRTMMDGARVGSAREESSGDAVHLNELRREGQQHRCYSGVPWQSPPGVTTCLGRPRPQSDPFAHEAAVEADCSPTPRDVVPSARGIQLTEAVGSDTESDGWRHVVHVLAGDQPHDVADLSCSL